MIDAATRVLLAVALTATASAFSLDRPDIQPFPLTTGSPAYNSPSRDSNKTCVVPASTNGSDSAPAILSAFQTCNDGGTVVLDTVYNISSPLNLTFLSHVDVSITGTISFNPDIAFWTSADGAFPITYQNSSTFWKFGGEDVNIYGGGVGTINGNGEVWWDAQLTNDSLVRPILFVADGLEGATISGLNFVNPPNVSVGKKEEVVCEGNLTYPLISGSTSLPTAAMLSLVDSTCLLCGAQVKRLRTLTDGIFTDPTQLFCKIQSSIMEMTVSLSSQTAQISWSR